MQAKAAASYVKRRPTDVALVLSLINSAVLLVLLGGLGGAGYLAKTGQLEGALLALSSPLGGSPSKAQGFFALVSLQVDFTPVFKNGAAGEPCWALSCSPSNAQGVFALTSATGPAAGHRLWQLC